MNLNRPGIKHDDGVFVFNEPAPVVFTSGNRTVRTFAEGYKTNCTCGGDCVYVNPWPLDEHDKGWAVRNHTLTDLK